MQKHTVPSQQRFWLVSPRSVIPMNRTQVLIGRSPDCQIIADDELISRHHARVTVGFRSLTIEDLASSNGTFVDGVAVTEPRELRGGELVAVGSQLYKVFTGTTAPRLAAQTTQDLPSYRRPLLKGDRAEMPTRSDESSPATVAKNPGSLIPIMETLHEEAVLYGNVDLHLARGAALQALEWAIAERSSKWIDYVVRLYRAIAQPMPSRVLDGLEVAHWQLGIDGSELLREYADTLRKTRGTSTEAKAAYRRVASLLGGNQAVDVLLAGE